MCPDCGAEVTPDVAFCFTCLCHVPQEAIDSTEVPITVAMENKSTQKAAQRSWEPGILGRVQNFGRTAASSNWRKNNPETAH